MALSSFQTVVSIIAVGDLDGERCAEKRGVVSSRSQYISHGGTGTQRKIGKKLRGSVRDNLPYCLTIGYEHRKNKIKQQEQGADLLQHKLDR